MFEENRPFSPMDYIQIALRRKWLVILPLVIIVPISIALCFLLPKLYKAETTILVIPQTVPDSFVKPTVTMNPSEYLNVISQQIMSRTRLETVIKKTSPDLYKTTPMEDIIAGMRSKIKIDVHRNEDSKSVASFTVSYQGKDPYRVAEITNLLASLFIEENLQSRAQQAEKTTDFLSTELIQLEKSLADNENKISDFKQLHIGSLPEQRDANLRMLDQLTLQQERIAGELNDAESRRILLQQQQIQTGGIPSTNSDNQGSLLVNSLQTRINEAQRRVTELRNKYTDEHPDVVSAKAELARLVSQAKYLPGDAQSQSVSPVGNEIDAQILALNLKIKGLHNEELSTKSRIADYQARIEITPKIEQELSALMRNYENSKNAYDDLSDKRMAARQAQTLEMEQQGEQFKVLDVAKVPLKPFKPNKPQILLVGILLALAIGGGLAYLAELMDQSFHSVQDVETYLELPVLASVPLVSDRDTAAMH